MGVLNGITVIAIEQAVAGPMCTLRLADAGARVIKVEKAGGETARNYDNTVQGTSAYFAWLNRGKESTVLDIKSEPDFGLLKAMLSEADVLVQNLSPGALKRLGLDDEVLKQINPRLITVSIVGYGQDTPFAKKRAYDLLVQAETGLCSVTGSANEPAKVGVSVADIATGTTAYSAVLEALIERSKTGSGRHIEIAMFDAIAEWMTVPLLHSEHAGIDTKRHGLSHAAIYPYGPFNCRNGTIIIAVQTDKEWKTLCTILDQKWLIQDKRFTTNADRVKNREQLDSLLEPLIAKTTKQNLSELCDQFGVSWANMSDVNSLSNHGALRRQMIELPNGAAITLPAAPNAQQQSRMKIPELGQHTEAIRKEFKP